MLLTTRSLWYNVHRRNCSVCCHQPVWVLMPQRALINIVYLIQEQSEKYVVISDHIHFSNTATVVDNMFPDKMFLLSYLAFINITEKH